MTAHQTRRIAREVKVFADERKGFRDRLLSEKEARIEELLQRIGGKTIHGIDENGRPAKTKPPHRLKACITSSGRVTLEFSRESHRRVARLLPETIEGLARKGGKFPGKKTTFSTDLLHAVRSLKHLREGHASEISAKDRVLDEVKRLNLELDQLDSHASKMELDAFRKRLQGFVVELEKMKLLLKRAAKNKLAEAAGLLAQVGEEDNAQEKYRLLTAACSKIAAVENRLGRWRDEDIIGMDFYNLLRERALRLARDAFLCFELKRYAGIFGSPCSASRWLGFYRHDMEVVALIESIGEEIQRPRLSLPEEQSARITAVSNLLLALDSPDAMPRLEAIGKAVAEEGRDYIALRELRQAYRALKKGDELEAAARLEESLRFYSDRLSYLAGEMNNEKWLVARHLYMARDHLMRKRRPQRSEALNHFEKAIRFIRMNKLDYFAEELEETGDAYTSQAVKLIKQAHEHFISGRFAQARECCLQAEAEIRKFQPK
ncbi:MAG: hypothetical protein QXH27_02760 [Candidatus Micrarchaeia archaeon]